ncbi:NF-X-like 1, partial [Striga asiatica]
FLLLLLLLIQLLHRRSPLIETPEQRLGFLQRPSPRLRQKHPTVKKKHPSNRHAFVQRYERDPYRPAHHPVECNPRANPLRPQLQRKNLRAVDPHDGPHPAREERHRHGPTRLARPIIDHGQPRRQSHQRHEHPSHACEEERPPPEPVDEERGDQYEDRLREADADGGEQFVLFALDPGLLEYGRAVEDYGVDAADLLEDVDAERAHGDVEDDGGRAEEVAPHTLAVVGARGGDDDVVVVVAVLGYAGRLFDVVETEERFFGGVGGLVEDALRLGDAALHDEPTGGLRHDERADDDADGRDDPDAEHEPPPE